MSSQAAFGVLRPNPENVGVEGGPKPTILTLRQVLTEKPAHPPIHLIFPPQPVMVGSRYKLATEGLGKRIQNWL